MTDNLDQPWLTLNKIMMGDAAMTRGGVAGGPEAQVWWRLAKLTIGGPFLVGPTYEAIRSKAHDGGLGTDI